ncbi:MAG: lysophospholipid acyltransferase family protein [Verrucomicrobiota bacterium]
MTQNIVNGWLRSRRLGSFAAVCMGAGLDRPGTEAPSKAHWLHRHASGVLRAVGLEVKVSGHPGDARAWVGNHLGYLDVIGLGSVAPVAFVAKSEVASWPLLGALATRGGTIYVDRSRRMAVGTVVDDMKRRAETGVPVVFFPEGTSSSGSDVLPFHASLFAPVVDMGWKVAPFAIRMESSAGIDAAYWGDMTFGPHFLRLMGHRRLVMHLRFGESTTLEGDRKSVAAAWRDRVVQLHSEIQTHHGLASAGPV